jgi:hypothetical protein
MTKNGSKLNLSAVTNSTVRGSLWQRRRNICAINQASKVAPITPVLLKMATNQFEVRRDLCGVVPNLSAVGRIPKDNPLKNLRFRSARLSQDEAQSGLLAPYHENSRSPGRGDDEPKRCSVPQDFNCSVLIWLFIGGPFITCITLGPVNRIRKQRASWGE